MSKTTTNTRAIIKEISFVTIVNIFIVTLKANPRMLLILVVQGNFLATLKYK